VYVLALLKAPAVGTDCHYLFGLPEDFEEKFPSAATCERSIACTRV
jgi:hypothetical protein